MFLPGYYVCATWLLLVAAESASAKHSLHQVSFRCMAVQKTALIDCTRVHTASLKNSTADIQVGQFAFYTCLYRDCVSQTVLASAVSKITLELRPHASLVESTKCKDPSRIVAFTSLVFRCFLHCTVWLSAAGDWTTGSG